MCSTKGRGRTEGLQDGSSQTSKNEVRKGIQIGKRVKQSPFADNIILYIENPNTFEKCWE